MPLPRLDDVVEQFELYDRGEQIHQKERDTFLLHLSATIKCAVSDDRKVDRPRYHRRSDRRAHVVDPYKRQQSVNERVGGHRWHVRNGDPVDSLKANGYESRVESLCKTEELGPKTTQWMRHRKYETHPSPPFSSVALTKDYRMSGKKYTTRSDGSQYIAASRPV